METTTEKLRKIVREELKKITLPLLREIVKESLIKNSVNEVLINLIAESIVDKQEATQLMKEQVEEGDIEIPAFKVTSNSIEMPTNKLTPDQRNSFKSKYEQMMNINTNIKSSGKVPLKEVYIDSQQEINESQNIDTSKVINMLPEFDIEGKPLRVGSLPDHLASALTKDYRQILKNIHTSVDNK